MGRPSKPDLDRFYDFFDDLKLDEQQYAIEVLKEKRRTKLKLTSKAMSESVAGNAKQATRTNGPIGQKPSEFITDLRAGEPETSYTEND